MRCSVWTDLHGEGSQDDGAEDGISKYAIKDVSLSVNLAGINLVEKLHEDKGVEYYSVMFRGGWVEWSMAAAVNVENALAWRGRNMGTN